MTRELIKRYLQGGTILAEAIHGLSAAEMRAFPVPGKWSVQQLVCHLLDSDLVAADRMKRIIAEERPALLAYDETLWSERLFYDKLDEHVVVQVFHKHRVLMGTILANLPESAFERVGVHNQRGVMTLRQIVQIYIDHVDHHLKYLREKRVALGKPLPG